VGHEGLSLAEGEKLAPTHVGGYGVEERGRCARDHERMMVGEGAEVSADSRRRLRGSVSAVGAADETTG